MSITSQFARGRAAHGNQGEKFAYMAARAYRYWRDLGYRAAVAFNKARLDAFQETARYPRACPGPVMGAADETGARWCEDPAAVGLRFVGFADEIAGDAIRHKGWYTDEFGDSDVYRGAVYQLPGKHGRARYVPGYRAGATSLKHGWQDMSGTPAARLDLSRALEFAGDYGGNGYGATGRAFRVPNDDLNESNMLDAARAADEFARVAAEQEQEWQAAYRAGQEARDLLDSADTARKAARALIAEMAAACGAVNRGAVPAIRAALKRDIRRDLETWRDNRRKAESLVDHYKARRTFGTSALHVALNGEPHALSIAFSEGFN